MNEPAMAASHFAGKGPAQPLVVSEEGQKRFFVGLSWGAKDIRDIDIHVPQLRDDHGHYDLLYFFKLPFHLFRIFVLSIVKHAAPKLYQRGVTDYDAWKRGISDAGRYDLDLSCYVYDRQLNLQCIIGPAGEHYSDDSKKVYHTGDDQHGSAGGHDNERAFIELRGLPPQYAHFFFVVETDGRYSLNETPHVHLRLADSRTNRNMLHRELAAPDGAGDMHGYVFCHVFRADTGDAWEFRDIDEHKSFSVDYVKHLQRMALRA